MYLNTIAAQSPDPCLLVVEDNLELGLAVVSRLRQNGATVVLASSAREAVTAVRDAVFMDNVFDGLLVSFNLPDATVYSVVNAFREEFPTRMIAVMTDREDVCLKLWSAARAISLFRKPLVIEELDEWAVNFKCTVTNNFAGSR